MLTVQVEEVTNFGCGPLEGLAIAKVYLVTEEGFNQCSAEGSYFLNPTDYTTAVHNDRHLFSCLGSGNRLGTPNRFDLSFKGKTHGKTFYLIGQLDSLIALDIGCYKMVLGLDVSNLTEYDATALGNEESGGRCVYYGMKLKIEIAAGT